MFALWWPRVAVEVGARLVRVRAAARHGELLLPQAHQQGLPPRRDHKPRPLLALLAQSRRPVQHVHQILEPPNIGTLALRSAFFNEMTSKHDLVRWEEMTAEIVLF